MRRNTRSTVSTADFGDLVQAGTVSLLILRGKDTVANGTGVANSSYVMRLWFPEFESHLAQHEREGNPVVLLLGHPRQSDQTRPCDQVVVLAESETGGGYTATHTFVVHAQ